MPARRRRGGTPGARPTRPRPSALGVEDLSALLRQLEGRTERADDAAVTGRPARVDREVERLRRLLVEAIAAEGDPSDDLGADEPRDAGRGIHFLDDDPFDEAFDDEAFDDEPFDGDEDTVGGAVEEEEDWPDGDAWWPRRRWARVEPARPINVDAGLVMRSRRGAVAATWWSKRFLAAVESTSAGGRLARGRTYARRGQVMDLTIGAGLVESRVQGTRPTPYAVRIAMPATSDDEWERVVDELAAQAGHAARLLAGELPHEIEEIFGAAGVTLFPSPSSRLSTDCSCPDWANPCKHVAAVCFLVAEAFDRDPFLLLAWRGRDRETLLAQLRERRGAAADPAAPPGPPVAPAPSAPPLSECTVGFWKSGPELARITIVPRAAEVAGAVLRPMARGILDVGGSDLADALEPLYQHLGREAERRAYGSAGGSWGE